MGFALLLWLLVSLVSISLVGNYPLWALGLGAVGGTGVGIFLFGKADDGIGLRTPLDVPIALLLFLPATMGLYASPDFERSVRDVFQLGAGVGLFYGVVWWGTDLPPCPPSLKGKGERRSWPWVRAIGAGICRVLLSPLPVPGRGRGRGPRDVMVVGFMCLGAALALGSLLVMAVPTVKLPVMGRLFAYLPNVLPRRVNPNYVGGMLVFFAFLPLWRLIWCRGRGWLAWVIAGAVWGGLLLAQSRGALLGAGMALAVTMACQFRWARWLALLGLVSGAFLFAEMGIGTVLDPVGAAGAHRTWEGRAELWQRAVYIAQDFSFTGIGLHGFPVVVDLLYPLFLIGPNARMPHAHNMFLQVAVDMGIPGFVAFWMLLGAWGGMVWDALRRTAAGSNAEGFRPVVLGLFGGMLAHVMYGVMDAITLGEKAGVAFWMVLALTVAVWQQVRRGGDDGA